MLRRAAARWAGTTLALLLAAPSTGYAQADPPRGVQFAPDGTLTFVNKDVGLERYAITQEDDGTVTGNVFFEDCRRPKFIVCTPTETENEFACEVATACETSPCGFAGAFATNVILPEDFFEVPAESPGNGGEPGEAEECPTTSRALQESDDGERIFVNKDVDGQRYAITQFTADRSITGNVFVGPDVPPKFIVCDALGEPDEHRWQCEVSDPCPAPPAECTFGGFSTEVTLPADFFVFDENITQTTNAFGTTEAATDALRIGAAAIPTGGGADAATHTDAAPAVVGDAQAQATACPGGGSVEQDGDTLTYLACRVGSLVCDGTGIAGGGSFSATLSCLDLDRDLFFDLLADLRIVSTQDGDAMSGIVRTEQEEGAGFGLTFEELSVAKGESGGAAFGTTMVSNVKTHFPGTFSDFEYPFDGSETVIITAFIPVPPGFDTQLFELNLVTGQLTPLDQ